MRLNPGDLVVTTMCWSFLKYDGPRSEPNYQLEQCYYATGDVFLVVSSMNDDVYGNTMVVLLSPHGEYVCEWFTQRQKVLVLA